jgi:hypothetical protein
MTTLELKKLIREEARKIIAENKNKSNKLEEGLLANKLQDFVKKAKEALAKKVTLDGSILASEKAKPIIKKIDAAVKGKPETFQAYKKMAEQMNIAQDKIKENVDKIKEAIVYADLRGLYRSWFSGDYMAMFDPTTFEFALVAELNVSNPNLAEDSMQVALKRTIRESAKKSTTTKSLKK